MTKKEWDDLKYGAVVRWNDIFVYMVVVELGDDRGRMCVPLAGPNPNGNEIGEMSQNYEGWELLSR